MESIRIIRDESLLVLLLLLLLLESCVVHPTLFLIHVQIFCPIIRCYFVILNIKYKYKYAYSRGHTNERSDIFTVNKESDPPSE